MPCSEPFTAVVQGYSGSAYATHRDLWEYSLSISVLQASCLPGYKTQVVEELAWWPAPFAESYLVLGTTQNWQLFGLLVKRIEEACPCEVFVACKNQRDPLSIELLCGKKGYLDIAQTSGPLGISTKAQHFCEIHFPPSGIEVSYHVSRVVAVCCFQVKSACVVE